MTEKRSIAGTPVKPIGLGCMSLSWAYGPPSSDAEAERILHRALDLGYDHLDTARIYGNGHNEEIIGRYLSGRRNAFFLASKTGIIVDGDERRIDCRPETIRAALEKSLSLLRTDVIDLYYLHRPDPNVPIEDSAGELARLIQEGKIRSYGLSEMSAETLRRAATVHPVAAMQTEYSPWTRNPEIAVLEACRELGTCFVAFSPVGRGALAGGVRDPAQLVSGDIRATMPRFQPDNWPVNAALIARFETIARENGVTPAQLSLAWTVARGPHVVAIPGTADIAHLEENIARWDWRIPDEVAVRVDALFTPDAVAGNRYGEQMRHTVTTEEFA
jgi:aryl-alcohol dehydrogenase-like predicted oxidoreductase